VHVAVEDRDRRRAGVERRVTREQLVRDDAECVDVGVWTERAAGHLLGRHVRRCPDRRVALGERRGQRGVGARDAEVRDLDAAVAAEEDVLGFEVPMRDPVRLGVGEAGEDPLEHGEHLRQSEMADEPAQRAAADVLHRDVGDTAVLEEVEQRDDVRVMQPGREPRLAHEAPGERRVGGLELEALERDVAVERRLSGEIHDGHSAACQDSHDLVAAHALLHGTAASLTPLRTTTQERSPRSTAPS
jgi:hypothetical protein